jgi:nitroreductase
MDQRLGIIFARRSIRAYTDERLTESEITSLLQAGMAAPSANNRQPWHMVVVTDKDMLKALADVHSYGKMLPHAALAIVICGDPSLSDWWVQDCSAATENILVAAAGLGLGGVWLGCHGRPEREQAIRGLLDIPDHVGVLCIISIGHPGERKEPRTQYNPARVHKNKW